ncbi:MAG TPA: ABC transporter permease [Dictyobacter sp.]|jgi:peptide/nickel transport system permease protein|nr:ABC transporter permease [Dictyobacter sp.]
MTNLPTNDAMTTQDIENRFSPSVADALLFNQPLSVRVFVALGRIWQQLTKSKKVAIGCSIVLIFVLVAIFGPFFIHQDPNLMTANADAAPSAAHLLGTTTTGQDIFSQLIVGTRSSIFWGLVTGVAVTFVSIVVGLIGGYFGGMIDEILSLVTNVFLVLPALPLAIVLASYFPRGPVTVSLVITLTSWAWGARVLRAQTMSMRSREFVAAARSCGESTFRLIFFEIFPNEISIVAANFVSTTLYVILASASLEFLGLGNANIVTWGSMFYWAQTANALFSGLWWWFVPPGLCIALLGAGLSLINFGIDEIADPRLRREKLPARWKKRLRFSS